MISNKFTTAAGCTGCLLPLAAIVVFILSFSDAGSYALLPAGIIAGAGILLFTVALKIEGRRKRKQREKLFSYEQPGTDFKKMPSVASHDLLTRVAIDFRGKRLYIWTAHDDFGQPVTKPFYGMAYRLDEYAFEDVEAAALVENGEAEAITAAFSTLPIEQFVTSDVTDTLESGDRETDPVRVQLLALIVQVDDKVTPFHQVNFHDGTGASLTKKSAEYKEMRGSLQKWMNYMDELLNETYPTHMKRVHMEERAVHQTEDSAERDSYPSVGEEALSQMEHGEPAEAIEPLGFEKERQQPGLLQPADPIQPVTAEPEQPKEPSYFEKILKENKRMMQREREDGDEENDH
ncbi:hypothetical protein NCCP2716_28230 [Sporosarcina sp. NCCP-2716]|uniref:hypothetical protein n=1 Tax=Sporosarcina sp. NCCP-2716 TaxID=2943679 RepID=UPI00203A71AB|nr:hypothetical protein [Sporosarcina sp. NCCP-2716]GKV70325.1 hypothetical protein NCCP2716_28230 [Sporosarcina sp. NCCP-2716]